MDLNHFSNELDRLSNTFGERAYGDERVKIIWREVQEFSNEWLTRIVDEFIGSHRLAPLMPEFREHISRERERLYAIDKRKNAIEAESFMRETFNPEIATFYIGEMKRMLSGKMSALDKGAFLKLTQPYEIYTSVPTITEEEARTKNYRWRN